MEGREYSYETRKNHTIKLHSPKFIIRIVTNKQGLGTFFIAYSTRIAELGSRSSSICKTWFS
jgi:hypothetical protein